MNKEILLSNIDKIHTTEMGSNRIRKNLNLDTFDVVEYCKNRILDKRCNIYKFGKNWYCEIDDIRITINSYSYTIITASIINERMKDRIKENEDKLDNIIEVLNELEVSIDKLDSIKDFIKDINNYYGSKNWFKDKKTLESGKDKNVKAGVLSEDTVWNTLGRIDEYIDKLNEIKEDIYK